VLILSGLLNPAAAGELSFSCQEVGDIDGDGKNDIVVHTWASNRGVDSDGSVTWYAYPDWKPTFILQDDHLFGDGVVIVDLDNDVVTSKGNNDLAEVWWLEIRVGRALLAGSSSRSPPRTMPVKRRMSKRTKDPKIFVLLNQGDGRSFKTVLVANKSAYKTKLGDLDNDGNMDMDILTERSWEDPPIQLFRNLTR